jgi:hypothetical protein
MLKTMVKEMPLFLSKLVLEILLLGMNEISKSLFPNLTQVFGIRNKELRTYVLVNHGRMKQSS